jgi:PIN domain nuclease of toxin-antitoxin system
VRGNDRGASDEAGDTVLGLMTVEVRAFDNDDARQAAALRPPTRRLGISFAGRACLVLGRRLVLPVLAADRRWAELDIGVEVRLIR